MSTKKSENKKPKSTKKSSKKKDCVKEVATFPLSEPSSPTPGKISLPQCPQKNSNSKIQNEHCSSESQLSSEPASPVHKTDSGGLKTNRHWVPEPKKSRITGSGDESDSSVLAPEMKLFPNKGYKDYKKKKFFETDSSESSDEGAQVYEMECPDVKKSVKSTDIPHYFEENYKYLNHTFEKAKSQYIYDLGPSFSDTVRFYDLCNLNQTEKYIVDLDSLMKGDFFKINNVWTTYRRNYIHVNSQFTLTKEEYPEICIDKPCWLIRDGKLDYIDYFSIGLTCRVTNVKQNVVIHQNNSKRELCKKFIPKPIRTRPSGTENASILKKNDTGVEFSRLILASSTGFNRKLHVPFYGFEMVTSLHAHVDKESIVIAESYSVPIASRALTPCKYKDSHLRNLACTANNIKVITPFYLKSINPPVKNVEELFDLDQLSLQNHNIYAHSEIQSCLEETVHDRRLVDLNTKLYSMNRPKSNKDAANVSV
ncbi:hypothetical protein BY458DRAFT_551151 [Sporodiniella umbellata]|nr:hypothetical protein BY458DRAFT_551151 [Sporodiniella umbellata]